MSNQEGLSTKLVNTFFVRLKNVRFCKPFCNNPGNFLLFFWTRPSERAGYTNRSVQNIEEKSLKKTGPKGLVACV
ncbi:MAG: hypothetical protein COA65_06555 [Rhodospirillaceae bacterium]|nr:MAG: hypothetical protein COA65_06555 [Rhodospirillaceae bacterium]